MHAAAKIALGAILVVVVPWALPVLLSLGPTGWLAIATGLAVVGLASIVSDSADTPPPVRVNCPVCGAPDELDATDRSYSGEPVSPSD